MAERCRAVRVSGLPTDVEDDRLRDKLLIYFLRARNGGGEVESVTIARATPTSALITFEETEAAQRIVRQSRHTLDLDGRKYELVATEHRESLDPDKVVLSLQASVNCSLLPGGALAVELLHESHPDVQMSYVAEGICTLLGDYSNVQAALAQLLGPHSPDKHPTGRPDRTDSRSAQADRKSLSAHSGKPNRQRGQSETVHRDKLSDEHNASSRRDLTSRGHGGEDADLQPPAAPEDNSSLIVDADMFQYLQKHRSREYRYILSLYDVEAVDVTNQGLTTLFLQVAAGVTEGRRAEQGRLESARTALSRFFQANESKLCRAQLAKSSLSPGGGLLLQRGGAMESLNARLPKLLLNEDDANIYIVGSIDDVSEAKRLLLLDQDDVRATKDDVANLLRYPSYDSSFLSPGDKTSVVTASPAEGRLSDGRDQLLRSRDDERRAAEAKRFEIDARFRDLGLPPLGGCPTDFTLRGPLSPSRQARAGPMLGRDVLSETAGFPRDRVPRAESQITGGDILFKGTGAVHSPASSTQIKTSSNSNCLDAGPGTSTPTLSTALPSLSGSTGTGSGSTLRRASSFSGTPQQKAPVTSRKSQDDSGRSTSRARSSSGSAQTGSDGRDVHNAEVTVSILMWQHIKEAYGGRVKDLTADDVQMKESRRQEGGGFLTVSLSGTNPSRVSSCHLGLQKLVESVGADFSRQVLLLSELGVAGPKDETLKACCADVCSRYKKISILILKQKLLLLGPEQLCSRVGATLREVFSTELSQTPKQQDFSDSSPSSSGNPSTLSQKVEEHRTLLRGNSDSQATAESQTGRAEEVTGGDQERGAHHERDVREAELANGPADPPSPRKTPVYKEKVKSRSTDELEALFNHPAAGSAARGNGVGSSTGHSDEAPPPQKKKEKTAHKDGPLQRNAEVQVTAAESRSAPRDLGHICVCGDDGASAVTTKCGVSMCPKCLDTVHAHCRVCHAADGRTPRGIRGQMSHFKLRNEEAAVKVTYCINEGVQGKDHPSPGSPFHGGVFDAFLPDCEATDKLLPRLEEAFRRGLTFTVTGKEAGARVTWDCIPHKTSLQGGKSGNGYPDATYLTRLSQVLTSHGIEEEPDFKSQ